jgi:hypothetical protein
MGDLSEFAEWPKKVLSDILEKIKQFIQPCAAKAIKQQNEIVRSNCSCSCN